MQRQISFSGLKSVQDYNYTTYSAELIREFICGFRKVPLLSRITIFTNEKSHTVQLDSVKSVMLPVTKNGKLAGVIIGGIIDIGLIIYALQQPLMGDFHIKI